MNRANGAKIEEYRSNFSERPSEKVRELAQCGEVARVSTPRSSMVTRGSRLTKKAVLTPAVA